MVAILTGVLGVVVGGLVALSLALRRAESHRDDFSETKAELAVRSSELAAANSELARVRLEHEAALGNMEGIFENLSNRVLQQTVHQFNQSQ
jgi:MFS superfamily sulfate permease-like transporter